MFGEGIKLRFAIAMVVLFLISGWYAFQELRYAIFGRTVEATVTGVEHRRERVYRRRGRHTTRDVTDITVQFPAPDNTPRMGELTQSGVSAVQPQQKLMIQYLPGDADMVRLSGQQNWLSIVFFLGGLTAMIGTVVWVGMEANRPYASSRLAHDDRPVRAIVPRKKKRVLKPLKPVDEA